MLSEIGIKVILEAEDGERAKDILYKNRGRVDLIISDWNMPNKSGFEFLQEIRTLSADIPFLMVTARADQDSVVNAKQGGVNGYLLKPFTLDELQKKITGMLQ